MKTEQCLTQSRNNIVFSLTEQDIHDVALDYLGRELTDDEMDMFVNKFTIYDWYDHVVCHIQSFGFEEKHV